MRYLYEDWFSTDKPLTDCPLCEASDVFLGEYETAEQLAENYENNIEDYL